MLQKFKNQVKELKKQSLVLYYAYSDHRMPFWKKMFLGLVVGYLFSPIDLIPDFIPVIGFLDDLLLIPLGISVSLKLIPQDILADSIKKADEQINPSFPVGKKTAFLIVILWITGIFLTLLFVVRFFIY